MTHVRLATNSFLVLSPRVEKCSGILCFLKILVVGFFFTVYVNVSVSFQEGGNGKLCFWSINCCGLFQQSLQKQPIGPYCAE